MMPRLFVKFLALVMLCGPTGAALAQSGIERSDFYDFRVVTVADGLSNPWSMTWLPNGDMLVTERPGRLRIIRDGELLPDPVPGVPEVLAEGQGGLFDVLPHPDFANNRLLYLSLAKPQPNGSTTAVYRGRFENDRLQNVEEIFNAASMGRGHYGARMAFDGDGHLFLTVGDRQAPPDGDLENHPAQLVTNHQGVVLRLTEDGGVPDGNPLTGHADARPEIYSYGHRNPQGLAIDPETGNVWITEHGPQGGDELNLIRPGNNYGWPVIGYGVNYGPGEPIHDAQTREGMELPVHYWVPSIATSGLMVYTGSQFPAWQGNIFAGGMAGQQLARLTLNEDRTGVQLEETLVPYIGRIRDVRQGPDGYIYLAIEARDGSDTPIVRLEPLN